MRLLVLAAFAAGMFLMTVPTDANAVVCAKGVHRAGCAGRHGAVLVKRPVVVCRTVWVDGVRVRRCR